jgi:outer membrane protein
MLTTSRQAPRQPCCTGVGPVTLRMDVMRVTSKCIMALACLLALRVGTADTLWDIYQKARQNDPQLREADANRMANREARPQALGALLPQLSASGNKSWDSADGFRTTPDRNTTTNVIEYLPADFINRGESKGWSVDVRQSVFRWDQWIKLRQSSKQSTKADIDYRVAELSLYTRVAEAYFSVLAAEDTLAANASARDAIGRQLEQSQKRFEVGLIAITDVQEAQSGYDQAVAAEILAKRQLATSKEALREIIGDYPGELSKPKSEIPLVGPAPADEGQWVEAALEQNLQLQSAQLAADIAKDDIGAARSVFLPSVDFVASRSNSESAGQGQSVTRPGTLDTVDSNPTDGETDSSSFGFQVTMPLFSGGVNRSRVEQTVYLHRAAKERLERTARQTERQTRDAFLAVESEISRVKALRQALTSAQTALQATEAGFEVGTRTTVDVLAGRRTLVQAETNYARSRYDYIINVLRLKEAAGSLDDADVQEVNSWLEPSMATKPETPSGESAR